MSDHQVLYVAVQPEESEAGPSAGNAGPSCSPEDREREVVGGEEEEKEAGEDEPLINGAECRICQEEDSVSNLESPCGCSGSLKYAHRKCVQHWCNEKGDIICEICHKPYQSGYTAQPRPTEETAIDIGGGWTVSGTPLDLRDPRILAIAEAEHQFIDAEYNEYDAPNSNGAAFCRSATLILMALLLLRHTLTAPETDSDGDNDNDIPVFFSLFILRVAGFLLPCYIMAWAITIMHQRRQRQEAAALAATRVAFVVQSAQRRGLQFGIAPGHSPISPQEEAV